MYLLPKVSRPPWINRHLRKLAHQKHLWEGHAPQHTTIPHTTRRSRIHTWSRSRWRKEGFKSTRLISDEYNPEDINWPESDKDKKQTSILNPVLLTQDNYKNEIMKTVPDPVDWPFKDFELLNYHHQHLLPHFEEENKNIQQ